MLSQENVKIACHGAFIVAAVRPPRMAGAAIVRCHDAEAGSDKTGHDAMPLPPRLREAMQKHQNPFALASRDVVKPQLRRYISHAVRKINLFRHVVTP